MLKNSAVRIMVALFVASLCSAFAPAQVSLQDQLSAQYKVVNITNNGTVVVDPGTVLVVQKGGIISVPFKAVVKCSAKFEDNALHASTGFCAGMMKNVSQYFKKGDKVYPLKIEVNASKEKVSFQVVSCDSCNGVDPATGMKGEVVFQFGAGYLEKASAGTIEDIIAQVFAISNDDQGGNQDQGNQSNQGDQQQAQGGDQQQDQQANIQLGMTIDQVTQALGNPQKTVNLGAKQIYVYKDLKITFVNGKVSDVQ
jgi:archaellum component FlaF (FlaF/FlaG flagellin family)